MSLCEGTDCNTRSHVPGSNGSYGKQDGVVLAAGARGRSAKRFPAATREHMPCWGGGAMERRGFKRHANARLDRARQKLILDSHCNLSIRASWDDGRERGREGENEQLFACPPPPLTDHTNNPSNRPACTAPNAKSEKKKWREIVVRRATRVWISAAVVLLSAGEG